MIVPLTISAIQYNTAIQYNHQLTPPYLRQTPISSDYCGLQWWLFISQMNQSAIAAFSASQSMKRKAKDSNLCKIDIRLAINRVSRISILQRFISLAFPHLVAIIVIVRLHDDVIFCNKILTHFPVALLGLRQNRTLDRHVEEYHTYISLADGFS